jgi:hypothetical protein
MNTFKDGDKVVCIKNSVCAYKGETGVYRGSQVNIDKEVDTCTHLSFWELVTPERTVITWENLQVGDQLEEMDLGEILTIIHITGPIFYVEDLESESIFYTIKELQKNFTIVQPKSPVQEMTVEEVSKLVGKMVKIVEG